MTSDVTMGVHQIDLVIPGMDIEEVSLSFLRRPHDDGMPTLRSFIRINDWPRVEDFFKTALSPSREDIGHHRNSEDPYRSNFFFVLKGFMIFDTQ